MNDRPASVQKFVSAENKIVEAGDAEILGASMAALYGKGVFTSVAIFDGKPFLWDKHWRRLSANAAAIGIDISGFSENGVLDELAAVLEKNGSNCRRARITFFDESVGGAWAFDTSRKISLMIMTADLRVISDKFRLTISPHRVNTASPLAGIKSCNYLENLLAIGEAKERGFDEAIRLNERGEATGGCLANLFWLKDEKLKTPRLTSGCLPGTTREFILENLECAEVEGSLNELLRADEIFLASAGIGIVQVVECDNRKLEYQPHEILELISRTTQNKN